MEWSNIILKNELRLSTLCPIFIEMSLQLVVPEISQFKNEGFTKKI